MIVNENGWGDKQAPKEEVKDVRKAKLQKEAPAKEEVVEDAEQE